MLFRFRCRGMLFLIAAVFSFVQKSSVARSRSVEDKAPASCSQGSLPFDIQNRLKTDFGKWRIQEPETLSQHARKTWEERKLPGCPGIAIGRFLNAETSSYALLLVPVDRSHADAGYRFLVISRRTGEQSYEVITVEQSDEHGASNYFIRRAPISEFFNATAKRKFHVSASEAILMVDSGDQEYEADVYFWSNGHFQQQPVDE